MADEMDVVDMPDIDEPAGLRDSQRARFREIVSILVRSDLVKGVTPARLRGVIEELGPTYVKIGQIMSMRPDMIPREYCEEFTKLRTDVIPMSADEVHQALLDNYGDRLDSIFDHIDDKPLGSASIAQAHSGVLKTGEKVVLKIERPGIYETMRDDFAMLRHAATALKFARAGNPTVVDFATVLDEMWEVAQEEMNFLIEARNNAEFAQDNAEEERIEVPKIYEEFTTARVLVMEFIDGISVGDIEALDKAGYDRSDLADVLTRNFVKQVCEDGFFHADPHPGNIWVRDNDIVWIDLGMMGRLSNRDRAAINDSIEAVINQDVSALEDVVLSIGIYKGKIDHSKLYSDIDIFLSKYGSLDLEGLNLGSLVTELMDIASSNGIQVPSSFSMFARSIATIEGTVTVLDPKISLAAILGEHVVNAKFGDIDLVDVALEKGRKLYNSGSKAVEIPGLTTDLLKMALRGRTKVNMETTVSPELKRLSQELVDRLVGGLIISAFLIGSSFLCTTDMKPQFLGIPLLGVIGFIVALILAAMAMWDTHKHRRGR